MDSRNGQGHESEAAVMQHGRHPFDTISSSKFTTSFTPLNATTLCCVNPMRTIEHPVSSDLWYMESNQADNIMLGLQARTKFSQAVESQTSSTAGLSVQNNQALLEVTTPEGHAKQRRRISSSPSELNNITEYGDNSSLQGMSVKKHTVHQKCHHKPYVQKTPRNKSKKTTSVRLKNWSVLQSQTNPFDALAITKHLQPPKDSMPIVNNTSGTAQTKPTSNHIPRATTEEALKLNSSSLTYTKTTVLKLPSFACLKLPRHQLPECSEMRCLSLSVPSHEPETKECVPVSPNSDFSSSFSEVALLQANIIDSRVEMTSDRLITGAHSLSHCSDMTAEDMVTVETAWSKQAQPSGSNDDTWESIDSPQAESVVLPEQNHLSTKTSTSQLSKEVGLQVKDKLSADISHEIISSNLDSEMVRQLCDTSVDFKSHLLGITHEDNYIDHSTNKATVQQTEIYHEDSSSPNFESLNSVDCAISAMCDEFDEGLEDEDLLDIINDGSDVGRHALLPCEANPQSSPSPGIRLDLRAPIVDASKNKTAHIITFSSDGEFDIDESDEEEMLKLSEPLPSTPSPKPICIDDGNCNIQKPFSACANNAISHLPSIKPNASVAHQVLSNSPQTSFRSHVIPSLSDSISPTNFRLIEHEKKISRLANRNQTLQPQESMNSRTKLNAALSSLVARHDRVTHLNGPSSHPVSPSVPHTTLFPTDPAQTPVNPFARPSFPEPMRERSPIIGLSPTTFLRTCFKIGELFREGKRCCSFGQDAVIELFARVAFSIREPGTARQHFVFVDLWRDNPPYPEGVLESYRGTPSVETETKVFIDAACEGEYKMARCLGRLKRDVKHAGGWLLHIENIRETDWEEIRWTKRIVSAGEGISETS